MRYIVILFLLFLFNAHSAPVNKNLENWLTRFESRNTNAPLPNSFRSEGIGLAKQRRAEMVKLIRGNPEEALKQKIPSHARSRYIREVRELLEDDVDVVGDLMVLAIRPEDDYVGPVMWRIAIIKGKEYEAFVYGNRLGHPSRKNIRLRGISIDNIMALQDEDSPTDPAADITLTSAWTEGLRKLILIRIDFPDLGLSFTETAASNMVNTCHSYFDNTSYGRAGFSKIGDGSAVTPILRMSNSAAYYGTNNYYNLIRSEARGLAIKAGYTLSNYNLDVICMGSVPGFRWRGLAYVGSSGTWLRNSFTLSTAGHELGHNFGLPHASSWNPSTTNSIGNGSQSEYGDIFDLMGNGSSMIHHFNARFKRYIDWLKDSEIHKVTTSGTYRLYALDQPLSTVSVPRGLWVTKNVNTNYWVELRQVITANQYSMNGVGIRWAGNGGQNTRVIDTTARSAGGVTDSPLTIGRTFSDPNPGIHITPIHRTVSDPTYMDVVINLGTFPDNQPPQASIVASTQTTQINTPIQFTVNATDPDGDIMSYFWNFGDNSFITNNLPFASKSWITNNVSYTVTCFVSDMKGGITPVSTTIQITDLSPPSAPEAPDYFRLIERN